MITIAAANETTANIIKRNQNNENDDLFPVNSTMINILVLKNLPFILDKDRCYYFKFSNSKMLKNRNI